MDEETRELLGKYLSDENLERIDGGWKWDIAPAMPVSGMRAAGGLPTLAEAGRRAAENRGITRVSERPRLLLFDPEGVQQHEVEIDNDNDAKRLMDMYGFGRR